MIKLRKINYRDLNSRQKENFNFQKLSAVLADYGFVTLRLSDDWNGADFIAVPASGDALRVQLKGRCTFDKRYQGKNLYIAFGDGDRWYLYDHDELLGKVLKDTKIVGATKSWRESGNYSFPGLSDRMQALVEPYRISGDAKPIPTPRQSE